MASSNNPKAKPSATRMYALPPPSTTSAATTTSTPTYTLNALPARIFHDGQMHLAPRHWNPQPATAAREPNQTHPEPKNEQHVQTAYLRGRKLFGTPIAVPTTHTATLLRVTDRTTRDTSLRDEAMSELEARRSQLDGAEYEEELEELRAADARGELSEELGVMETLGDVDADGFWVWGHEVVPGQAGEGAEEGGLVGGRLGEWAALAEAMHSY